VNEAAPGVHSVVSARSHRVPAPFRRFAVRSDEAEHAFDARSPYGLVHRVRTAFLDERALAGLAAQGWARLHLAVFSDIDYATTTPQDLAEAAPGITELAGHIARALQQTGVLGADPAAYRRSVATRIDYLGACGAGFHNDVSRHWSRCLFWVLALDLADVEFVMPHAGVRLPLAPGELLVFDPTMAHGLCRPADQGLALAASFATGVDDRQIFLTGEIELSDAQWAALGAPWLPVDAPEHRGALDLMVAEFDERSGAVQRLHTLKGSMARSTCHVDGMAG
jgi:hypothetical protein